MIRKMHISLLLAMVTLSGVCTSIRAEKFYVAARPETDSVNFASEAKLEFVEGETNSIIGMIEFDPANTRLQCGGRLRVDARTLKTGIEMRDEHMRERHLHTEQFPFIEFVPKSIEGLPVELVADSALKFRISGEFTVHGTTKTISAPATVVYLPDNAGAKAVIVAATFDIKLDDYGIPRPKVLLLKLAETIRVSVRFVASTANPAVTF